MKSHLKPYLLLLWILCLTESSLTQSYNPISPRLLSNESSSSQQEEGSTAIALEDGRQIQSPLPEDSFPAVFYFSAVPSQHSVVTVSSAGREITIYAKRIKLNIGSLSQPDIQPFDEKSAEFSSSKDNPEGTAFVTVPPLADSDVTIIAVSVWFKDLEVQEELEKTFSILASSQITSIFPGTPFVGSVAKDRYVYFIVNVVRYDCTLLISLTIFDEGKSDLVLAYGQNSRPTTLEHQFASISKKKTKVIEINKMDIYPLNHISGAWVIGVYGNTASTFSLTAIEEDQKMVSLQPETPLKMILEKSTSVNIKFFLEFKRHLQITFTKNSGEFDLYVTSISQDQDLATNIPSEAKKKWKISNSDLQSIINIPLQDPLACVSCLYLFHIEAKSSGDFSLLVNQEDKFLSIQNGFRYSGQLRPQESMAYVLKTSNNTEAAQLNVDLEGTELDIFVAHNPTVNATNYLWKETILSENSPSKIIQLKKLSGNPPKVWDGKREIGSERDFFYIIFSNPTNQNLSYSFPTAIKSSRTILFDTEYQRIDFAPYEKISFLYYSNRKDIPISVSISLAVNFTEAEENTQEALDLALRQGQIFKARYWEEKDFEGEGQEISLKAESAPKADNSASRILLSCEYEIEGQKGKYVIEAANLWKFNIRFGISISMYQGSRLYSIVYARKSQNSQQTFDRLESSADYKQTLDILITTPGKWYLWVYSCGLITDFELENAKKDNGLKTISNGQSYFYQETIENKSLEEREDRFKSVIFNPSKFESDEPEFYVYSAVINEMEFMNFELVEDPSKMDISYNYNTGDEYHCDIIVKFNPLKFQDTLSTDKIIYSIGAVLDNPYNFNELSSKTCFSYWEEHALELPVDHKEQITMSFSAEKHEKYLIELRAFIVHKSQTIKFITYPIGSVQTKNPFWRNVFRVFAGIIACILVMIMCRKCYQKLIAWASKPADRGGEGVEMNKNEKKKGYEAFEDEKEENKNEVAKNEAIQVDS